MTCNVGAINNGANATIQLIVQANAPGSGTNTATLAAALSDTMQLVLAALMAMIALGVIGKKS